MEVWAARSSFLWWLDHNGLSLVLEHNHSAVAELHGLARRGGRGGIRRESSREPVNVLVAAPLNECTLNLRNLSGKATGDLAARVERAIRLTVGAGAGPALVVLAVEDHDSRFESR